MCPKLLVMVLVQLFTTYASGYKVSMATSLAFDALLPHHLVLLLIDTVPVPDPCSEKVLAFCSTTACSHRHTESLLLQPRLLAYVMFMTTTMTDKLVIAAVVQIVFTLQLFASCSTKTALK